MPARVEVPAWLADVFLELPAREQDAIFAILKMVQRHPYMFPVRQEGRWKGLRWFVARNWLVYYDYVAGEDTIYLRHLWPARAEP